MDKEITGSQPSCVLLFSGYNNRAVLAFLRTLALHGVECAIIARSASDPIFYTSYRERVVHTRSSATLDLRLVEKCVAMAKTACKAHSVFIAPSTEALNRFLLEQREALVALGAVIPLSGKKCYESISDKEAFTALCRARGLQVPQEYSDPATAKLPFVAKPRQYIGKGGQSHSPVLVFDEAQRNAFITQYDADDFYFQAYVEGRSAYLLYYFSKDGQVSRFSQENLVQQPGGKSIVAARSARYHEEAISAEYEALFKEAGFTGLVMVELRVNAAGYYMIEANPRFWGPSQLFVDAGVNFFSQLLQDYGLCESTMQVTEAGEARYLWLGGLFAALKSGGELSFTGCTPDSFYASFDKWISHDLYKRNDSLEAFQMELR